MTLDLTLGTPYAQLGSRALVEEIASRFYDAMERDEPALARVHRLTPEGRVDPEVRARFALFLVGWLGGPAEYEAQHGHPRLRMRHARVRIDTAMRDAWLRAMTTALDEARVTGDVRSFLDARFAEVADFLRNTPG